MKSAHPLSRPLLLSFSLTPLLIPYHILYLIIHILHLQHSALHTPSLIFVVLIVAHAPMHFLLGSSFVFLVYSFLALSLTLAHSLSLSLLIPFPYLFFFSFYSPFFLSFVLCLFVGCRFALLCACLFVCFSAWMVWRREAANSGWRIGWP